MQIQGRAAAAEIDKQAEEMSFVQLSAKTPVGRTQYTDLANSRDQSQPGFSTSSSSPVARLLGYDEQSLP